MSEGFGVKLLLLDENLTALLPKKICFWNHTMSLIWSFMDFLQGNIFLIFHRKHMKQWAVIKQQAVKFMSMVDGTGIYPVPRQEQGKWMTWNKMAVQSGHQANIFPNTFSSKLVVAGATPELQGLRGSYCFFQVSDPALLHYCYITVHNLWVSPSFLLWKTATSNNNLTQVTPLCMLVVSGVVVIFLVWTHNRLSGKLYWSVYL